MLKKTLQAAALIIALTGVETAASPVRWTPAAIASPGYESSPTFTPDGRLMFFLSAAADFGNTGAVAADDNEFQVGPLLSPSGDRLLFAEKDGQRSGEMFLLDLADNPDQAWPPRCR